MSILTNLLLDELEAFDGSEQEQLRAIALLRAATWIAALSVIADVEGPARARESLEALAQADTFLLVLVVGWLPNLTDSASSPPPSGRVCALHARLVHALELRLEQEGHDPSRTVRAVEHAYRMILSRTLGQASGAVLATFLAIHLACRREILQTALTLIEESSETQPTEADARPTPDTPWELDPTGQDGSAMVPVAQAPQDAEGDPPPDRCPS